MGKNLRDKGNICNFAPAFRKTALVAELADALDLGSSVLRRAGSIPVRRTTKNQARERKCFLA